MQSIHLKCLLQAQTRQSMKYLVHKAFQCARLGPDMGAVMLKTTTSKSEVPQPQHGGLRGAAAAEGVGLWGFKVPYSLPG